VVLNNPGESLKAHAVRALLDELMDKPALQILRMFEQWNKETLDLHELFEAGGNDPAERTAVFDTVERLVREGLLEERGNDFYALTEEGQKAVSAESLARPEANS
jgi:DNA-binding IclR family transcriptional regulator